MNRKLTIDEGMKLQSLIQKNAHLKRINLWIDRLEEERGRHLAKLKEMRQEQLKLVRLLHEAVYDDNLSLFPEAEVVMPRSLCDQDVQYSMADFEHKKLLVRLAVAQIGRGPDWAYRLDVRTSGPMCNQPWLFAGEGKDAAVSHGLIALQCFVDKAASHPDAVHKEIRQVRELLVKISASVPPVISAPPTNWSPPRYQATHFSGNLLDGIPGLPRGKKGANQPAIVEMLGKARLPDTWPREGFPSLCPFFVQAEPYAAATVFGQSPKSGIERTVRLVHLVGRKEWNFKTVTVPAEAMDGALCGLVVEHRENAKQQFVIDQQVKDIELWDWFYTDLAVLGRHDDDRCSRSISPEELADYYDPKLLTRLQDANEITISTKTLLWVEALPADALPFVHTGTRPSMPENVAVLQPLIDPESFQASHPNYKGATVEDPWLGLSCRSEDVDGQVVDWRIGAMEDGLLVRTADHAASAKGETHHRSLDNLLADNPPSIAVGKLDTGIVKPPRRGRNKSKAVN